MRARTAYLTLCSYCGRNVHRYTVAVPYVSVTRERRVLYWFCRKCGDALLTALKELVHAESTVA